MLKKLIKHDFNSVFKYWWIAALSSFALSIIGGGCISLMELIDELPSIVTFSISQGLILVILGFAVFAVLSSILIYIRLYKNFFTDEGYLTFTLPVKRSDLLNSKLIVACLITLMTTMVFIANILVMLAIPFPDHANEFFQSLLELIGSMSAKDAIYMLLYIIEAIVLYILINVFSHLFTFCCITFASIIAKKAKILVSIGIYYGANCIFSGIMQTFYIFGLASLINWLIDIPVNLYSISIALTLLGLIAFVALFCALLYLLEYWMLDRKLNLN